MPAALIAAIGAYTYAYIVGTVAYMMLAMGAVYAAASSAQQRSQAASAHSNALQTYYNDVAAANMKNKAFTASKASSRMARVNATKYTSASEMQVLEAMQREKQSKKGWEGFKPRTTVGRKKDFGNTYSAKAIKISKEKSADLLPPTLLSSFTAERPESLFDVSNLSVQNFNTNFVGEAQDAKLVQ